MGLSRREELVQRFARSNLRGSTGLGPVAPAMRDHSFLSFTFQAVKIALHL
jgi:hypothetical protein